MKTGLLLLLCVVGIAGAATSAVVVDLDQASFGNEGPDRLPDVDDSATTMSEITYGFSATNSLFTEPGANAVPVYGGYSVTGSGTVSSSTYLKLNTDGYIDTRGVQNASGNIEATALLFWDAADFLETGHYTFGSTLESGIVIDVKKLVNAKGVNAILRDGDTYYLSEKGGLEGTAGILTVNGTNTRWAPIDPADFQLYDPGDATTFGLTDGTFVSRTFTNVTGVGLLAKADRGNGNPGIIEINDMVVSLQNSEDEGPPPEPPEPPVANPILTERPDWAGVYYNCGSGELPDFAGFEEGFVGRAARVRWRDIQPSYNTYDFSRMIEQITHAADNDYYYYCELWTGFHSPAWISNTNQVGENTVPWVELDGWSDSPYYLDEDYKVYIKAMFDELVATIASLPEYVREHMPFIQIGLGSTGDRKLYKRPNLDPRYDISDDDFVAYKKEITAYYLNAFASNPKTAHIRFLWNINDYDGDPVKNNPTKFDRFALWVRTNHNPQLRKIQFPYAIGYGSPGEKSMFEEHMPNFYGSYGSPYGSGDRWDGNPEFIRGEYNEGETAPTWMHINNPAVHYMWTAIAGAYSGFDAWETKEPSAANKEALEFSNRHAYYKNPEESPYAFVAFRDVLDYSDTDRFPTGTYGSASRGNTTRVQHILDEFSAYGAVNDDMDAATSLNLHTYLKETQGYNDCLWDVDANNCSRFITQIDANDTSAGYWHVGVTQSQPYGRYCRGFDHSNGMDTIYLDVDDLYFSRNRNESDGSLAVKIIYYAEDGGSWALKYHAQDGTMKTAQTVNNAGPGSGWQDITIDLIDALLDNGGDRGADLILESDGQTDCRFHLIELTRTVPDPPPVGYAAFALQHSLQEGAEGDDDDDGLSNFAEFALNGNPTNSTDTGLGEVLVDGSWFTFVHASNVVDGTLVYRLLDRTNLVSGVMHTNNWDTQTISLPGGDYATVSNHYEIGEQGQRFIQLHVEQE